MGVFDNAGSLALYVLANEVAFALISAPESRNATKAFVVLI